MTWERHGEGGGVGVTTRAKIEKDIKTVRVYSSFLLSRCFLHFNLALPRTCVISNTRGSEAGFSSWWAISFNPSRAAIMTLQQASNGWVCMKIHRVYDSERQPQFMLLPSLMAIFLPSSLSDFLHTLNHCQYMASYHCMTWINITAYYAFPHSFASYTFWYHFITRLPL